ncbi:hypothetical protein LXA43DRAFT_1016187 [Ganoderma leucocontextum]|nr:hypothetical protein LXA43DRAFT_1016187 [Ganoderma leucocontextum]
MPCRFLILNWLGRLSSVLAVKRPCLHDGENYASKPSLHHIIQSWTTVQGYILHTAPGCEHDRDPSAVTDRYPDNPTGCTHGLHGAVRGRDSGILRGLKPRHGTKEDNEARTFRAQSSQAEFPAILRTRETTKNSSRIMGGPRNSKMLEEQDQIFTVPVTTHNSNNHRSLELRQIHERRARRFRFLLAVCVDAIRSVLAPPVCKPEPDPKV